MAWHSTFAGPRLVIAPSGNGMGPAFRAYWPRSRSGKAMQADLDRRYGRDPETIVIQIIPWPQGQATRGLQCRTRASLTPRPLSGVMGSRATHGSRVMRGLMAG